MRKKQTSQTKSLEESELGPFTLLRDVSCPEKGVAGAWNLADVNTKLSQIKTEIFLSALSRETAFIEVRILSLTGGYCPNIPPQTIPIQHH